MKNIEKLGIDTLIVQFSEKYKEQIEAAISAKQAVEIAQSNFKKIAGPLVSSAKDLGNELVSDELSDQAIDYFETAIGQIVKIPFKVKS
jgi:nitrate reductase NapAB chaperone NapD